MAGQVYWGRQQSYTISPVIFHLEPLSTIWIRGEDLLFGKRHKYSLNYTRKQTSIPGKGCQKPPVPPTSLGRGFKYQIEWKEDSWCVVNNKRDINFDNGPRKKKKKMRSHFCILPATLWCRLQLINAHFPLKNHQHPRQLLFHSRFYVRPVVVETGLQFRSRIQCNRGANMWCHHTHVYRDHSIPVQELMAEINVQIANEFSIWKRP